MLRRTTARILPVLPLLALPLAAGAAPLPDVERPEVRPLRAFRNPDVVRCVRFSPDGKRLLALSDEDRIRVWDVQTGKQLPPFRVADRTDLIRVFALSPDGKALAVGTLHEIVVCDAGTVKIRSRHAVKDHYPTGLAFSPDGKFLASGGSPENARADPQKSYGARGLIVLWDVAAGKPFRRLSAHGEWHIRPAFAPDGRYLFTAGSDNSLRSWSVPKGTELRSFDAPRAVRDLGFKALAPSADGQTLAAINASLPDVGLWDVHTGKFRGRLVPFEGDQFRDVAFSPDDRFVAAGGVANRVRLWETVSGWEAQGLVGFGRERTDDSVGSKILSLAFSPDGRFLAAGGGEGHIALWDVSAAARIVPSKFREADDNALWDALVSPDAVLAQAALKVLAGRPAARLLPRVKEDLPPMSPEEAARIRRAVGDLGNASFRARQQAVAELIRTGVRGRPALDRLLRTDLGVDLRHRAEKAWGETIGWPLRRGALRIARAMQLLEEMHTPEARRMLEELARGEPEDPRAAEARAALGRLTVRP